MKVLEMNILVLGAENVGKSALTVRFLTKRFIGDYQSNEDQIYQQTVESNDQHFKVTVKDTCSKCDDNRNMSENLQWADAIVIVYDVCQYESFQTVSKKMQEMRKSSKCPVNLPIALLANKVDKHPKAHEVHRDEGRLLAEEYGCLFHEVSAAEGWLDVAEAFCSVLQEADTRRKIKTPMLIRKRRESVTRQVANKVLRVVSRSPKRT